MLDTKAIAAALAPAFKAHVEAATAPLLKRIEELEKRQPEAGPPGPQGEPGRDGKDGKDADMDALRSQLEAMVAALPRPVDGRDGKDGVDGKDGAPGEKGEPGRDGVDGKDGVSLAGAMIDRDGGLVVTLSNGETKALGRVVGRDGEKGEPGRDGQDGVGFDDLDVVYDGERTLTLRFARGERVKEFPVRLPVVLDRGVFSEGKSYEAGDGVSWGGSFWIAQADTTEKPGDGSRAWRLAVKRGRDGKDFHGPVEKGPVKVRV